MPHESSILGRFARRDTVDKTMFGFVRGMRRAMPNVTLENAVRIFASEFGIAGDQWNIPSQVMRYKRMEKDFYDDQRTKPDGKE